jgi:hypothetical protein
MHRNIPLITVGLASFGLAATAHAAAIPFENDFSTGGFSNQSGFTHDAGNQTITFSATGASGDVIGRGTEQLTGGAGASFTMETNFSFSNIARGSGNLGFGFTLFGQNADLSGNYLLADWIVRDAQSTAANQQRLRLFQIGVDQGLQAESNTTQASAVEVDYRLVLTATHTAGSTYDLVMNLFNADTDAQIGSVSHTYTVPWAEPTEGYYFGIRYRVPNGANSLAGAVDDFAVIPEPASLALVGVGGALMLMRRRQAN